MEKQEEFLDAAYVVFEKLCRESHKTLQFLQNQNVNNVKTHLMFLIMVKMLKYSQEVSMIVLVDFKCVIHEFLTPW